MNITKTQTITTALALALLATPQLVSSQSDDEKPNPRFMDDNTYLSINGTAHNPEADSFLLDYGDGVITVEFDDFDTDADGYKISDGDNVTVYGVIDDNFFDTTTIEAGSVYVKDTSTFYYASATDEEDFAYYYNTRPLAENSYILDGKVTDVNGRHFTINTGKRKIKVDTNGMDYNPVDNIGYQQVDEGDWVSVYGEIDYDLIDRRELEAESVVTLYENEDDAGVYKDTDLDTGD